jgi:hypothetical protein
LATGSPANHANRCGRNQRRACWAGSRKVPRVVFKPDWTRHAKAAPFKRNDRMQRCRSASSSSPASASRTTSSTRPGASASGVAIHRRRRVRAAANPWSSGIQALDASPRRSRRPAREAGVAFYARRHLPRFGQLSFCKGGFCDLRHFLPGAVIHSIETGTMTFAQNVSSLQWPAKGAGLSAFQTVSARMVGLNGFIISASGLSLLADSDMSA